MTTLWNQLERAARLRGTADAVSCNGQRMSWASARSRAARMASVLNALGVTSGARVAFLGPNGLTYMLMPFATECAGGVFVPMNSRLAVPELIDQLKDSTPMLLLAAQSFSAPASEAAAKTGVRLLMLDGDHGFESLVAKSQEMVPVARPTGDPIAIYYTGGTTGRSKGVICTSERLAINSLQWAHAVSARADERLLIVAPMFHMIAALNCVIASVLACDMTILERFTPEAALKAISEDRITNLALVPTMIDMLLAVDGFESYDLSSLRSLTYGGSPIGRNTMKGALQGFRTAQLYQIYGQTEGGPTISVLGAQWHSEEAGRAEKLRSAGKPMALTDVAILRPDGTECARGETGEIAVRGPGVSPGYWNRPDEDAAAHRNGWLHTGDAGYLDDDGFLFIVDRIKDMIVSGGENVYAAEVERVVAVHPAVLECAVIGIASDRWGEAVHAIVRLRPQSVIGTQDITNFCSERLAGFKVARSVEFRTEPFPLTGAGKVDKKALRRDCQLRHHG